MKVIKRFKNHRELNKLSYAEQVKAFHEDKVVIEFSRKEFEEVADAVAMRSFIDEKNTPYREMLHHNMTSISLGERVVGAKQWEVVRAREIEGMATYNKVVQKRLLLKSNCKTKGEQCPHGIRQDLWKIPTADEFKQWDDKVKTHCPTCKDNLCMLDAIG